MRMIHPCPGARVSQYFGEHPEWYAAYGLPGHEGLDFALPIGTPIYAPISGVLEVAQSSTYGLRVYIRAEGVSVLLAHLSDVVAVESVQAGQLVAHSGNTGRSTGPHLHFGIRLAGRFDEPYHGWVDPEPYLEEETMDRPSVLGVAFQTPPERGGAGTDAILASNIKWIKGIDPDANWEPGLFADRNVLARLWIGGDHVEADYYRRGSAGAKQYFEMLKPRYDKLLGMGISHVEGPNEPQATCGYQESPTRYMTDWATIAEFEYERARLSVQYGLRPWVFSTSTGTPELESLRYMLNTIKLASDAGGGWAPHEYGAPSVISGDGWHTLRIKRALEAMGNPDIRIIVGECGIDGGVIDGAHARWGWKAFARAGWVYDEPNSMDLGQTIMTEELYWRQMRWLDLQYCAIPQVIAATPFTHNPNSDWESFNWTTTLIQRTAALYENAPAPEPTNLEQRIVAMAQAVVLPLNSLAALAKEGIARGYVPASDEFVVEDHVAQVFRTPAQPDAQHIAYCKLGDWGNVSWIKHNN